MARKRVSFISGGKRVFFLAKRGASATYRRGKPLAKRGAATAYRGGRLTAQYGSARMNAYIARQKALEERRARGRKAYQARKKARPKPRPRTRSPVRVKRKKAAKRGPRTRYSQGVKITTSKHNIIYDWPNGRTTVHCKLCKHNFNNMKAFERHYYQYHYPRIMAQKRRKR